MYASPVLLAITRSVLLVISGSLSHAAGYPQIPTQRCQLSPDRYPGLSAITRFLPSVVGYQWVITHCCHWIPTQCWQLSQNALPCVDGYFQLLTKCCRLKPDAYLVLLAITGSLTWYCWLPLPLTYLVWQIST